MSIASDALLKAVNQRLTSLEEQVAVLQQELKAKSDLGQPASDQKITLGRQQWNEKRKA